MVATSVPATVDVWLKFATSGRCTTPMLPLSEPGVVEGEGGATPFCSTIIDGGDEVGVGDVVVATGMARGSGRDREGGAVTSIPVSSGQPPLVVVVVVVVVDSFSLSEFTSFSANVARLTSTLQFCEFLEASQHAQARVFLNDMNILALLESTEVLSSSPNISSVSDGVGNVMNIYCGIESDINE
uniref:Uncharacterized protein n=1 Tax=Anopheles atroparvus TaxID=41427 RepID=A0A182J2K1_ANOAO